MHAYQSKAEPQKCDICQNVHGDNEWAGICAPFASGGGPAYRMTARAIPGLSKGYRREFTAWIARVNDVEWSPNKYGPRVTPAPVVSLAPAPCMCGCADRLNVGCLMKRPDPAEAPTIPAPARKRSPRCPCGCKATRGAILLTNRKAA